MRRCASLLASLGGALSTGPPATESVFNMALAPRYAAGSCFRWRVSFAHRPCTVSMREVPFGFSLFWEQFGNWSY